MAPAILVASPRQIGSMPVASGSRLPTWPALRAPSSARTRCSAAFDDRPTRLVEQQDAAGHGAASAPSIGSAARRRGSAPRRPAAIARPRVDQLGQALRPSRALVVEHELQPRRMPQPQPPAELAAQEAARRCVSPRAPPRPAWREANGSEEDARRAHVGGHAHRGDRDVADARILDLARRSAPRARAASAPRCAVSRASAACHCSVIVRTTSTRAKHSIWSPTRTSW